MSYLRSDDEKFYRYAMDLFQKSGHAIISEPVFANHSFEQFAYIDTEDTIVLSKNQRNSFSNYSNISKLFTLENDVFEITTADIITVYSAIIHSDRTARSQCAFDAHVIIQKADRSDATIVLFKHENSILVSFMGYGQDVYLSDWFSADDEYLIERMHISNVSINSPLRYYVDFVYNLARDYYTHPVSREFAKYCSLPDDYFAKSAFDEIDREYVLEEIRKCLHQSEYEYGDDYVSQGELISYGDINFDKEFALIMLEMELEKDSSVTEASVVREVRTEKDYYELGNINPELFRDASLMVKWLERQDSNS